MKKLCAFFLCAVLLLSLSVTAAAVSGPSPENTFTAQLAADASGNPVTVSIAAAPEIAEPTAEEIQTVMGSAYVEGMSIVLLSDISVPAGTAFPVTITFSVMGVTPNTTGAFLHWNGSAWETVPTTFGDGTVTGVFDSLSPVTLVVAGNSTASFSAPAADAPKSPKTMDSGIDGLLIVLISVCFLGALYAGKKAGSYSK